MVGLLPHHNKLAFEVGLVSQAAQAAGQKTQCSNHSLSDDRRQRCLREQAGNRSSKARNY